MNTPWYKEPIAWLVFFLPFSAVVASISTYIIANTNPDTLVVGEYYKEGKSINLQVSKVKLAQKLGMRFSLQMTKNNLLIKPTGIEKIFPVLNISFHHPTLENKDFSLALTPDGNGFFRHHFENDVSGKWHFTLTPFLKHWKIQSTIYLEKSSLEQNHIIDLIPDPVQAH